MSAPVDTFARVVGQLNDLGVVGLRVPADREITAYIDRELHREHRSSADRRMWMNEQQMCLAKAIDDGTAIDGAAVPHDVSQGASAQLRAFEDQQTRADQLQNRIDALEAREAGAKGHLVEADRQLQLLSRSRTWRVAWGANAARRRLLAADQDAEPDALGRTISTIDRARRELAEPSAGSDDGAPA
jgi:hypothetical protein